MRNNIVNKIILVAFGVILILCTTILIQIMVYDKVELIQTDHYDAARINVYETLDSENQIYEISNNKVLDLNRPIITIEQTQIYKNRTNENSVFCSFGPNVNVKIIQIFEDGWASTELFDEIVYIKTDTIANIAEDKQNETTEPQKQTEPKETEPLPEDILGGQINEYDENGYLIVQEEVRTDGNVHARSGPSTRHKILKSLRLGARLTRIGIGPDGWSKVYIDGQIMYITSYYLSPTAKPTYTEVNEVVRATRDAYVRTNGTILSSKAGSLDEGQEIVRVGIGTNGWSQVIYKEQTLYVYSLYLEPVEKIEETEPETAETADTPNKTEQAASSESITPDNTIESHET